MHCHSRASQVSRLGVQRALGLPECATPPEEVYALAKRRGMDFVTITDHDTIAGVLEIADRPDVFISEELTVRFPGGDEEAHVLCYGIDMGDHEWLQAHSGAVEDCARYMHERGIACALAHPFYAVASPLSVDRRRQLAELFDVWEVRNGARSADLNAPAASFIATRGGVGIGGSDDHAGVDIGRTWTETPAASNPAELLAHVRSGNARAGGEHGSAAKWANAAIALALRSIGVAAEGDGARCTDPKTVLRMVGRLLREGDARQGAASDELTGADARRLLNAWLVEMELDHLDPSRLLAVMQNESFSHGDLFRRARRTHEQSLRASAERAAAQAGAVVAGESDEGEARGADVDRLRDGERGLDARARELFAACVPVVPYLAAATFLANETAKLRPDRDERQARAGARVAVLVDGIGAMHGVTRVIEEIRRRGVPGFEIEVVGTDGSVDRRLPCVAEVTPPHCDGLELGVPSLTAALQALSEGDFDVVHVCSPGPVGMLGALIGRALGLPVIGSYHTELEAYVVARGGEGALARAMRALLGVFYGACDAVLSPSPTADRALEALDIPLERLLRWGRGVDTRRFHPMLRDRGRRPAERIDLLYAGRLEREKGIALLADAVLLARGDEPRLHLLVAGGGSEEEALRARLGEAATFLGWLEGAELARAYASADAFVFPSSTDTFGQVILEAQASGIPVVAVAAGGPLALIDDRVSGLLCRPSAEALAAGVLELARSPLLSRRLAAAGLARARRQTWEESMKRLAIAYRRGLARSTEASGADAAPESRRDAGAGDDPGARRRQSHLELLVA